VILRAYSRVRCSAEIRYHSATVILAQERPMRSPPMSDLAEEFREFIGADYIIADRETQKPFECDGLTLYREVPGLVVMPDSVEQVERVMRICHAKRVPVIARGAGTGLSAGATPRADAVLLSLARLDKIIAIDPLARMARVGPGVRNLAISEAAARYGLFYGPDPSSQIACSIGGNVAENSGGVHCLKYGLTVHNVLRVEFVDVTGERHVVGAESLDAPGFDLLALLTGSEGMLGVVTEITVKLLPMPEKARVVMAAFASVGQAADAVGAVIAAGIIPAGLEMMDSHAIRAAEDFAHAGYPRDAAALLLCEVDGTEAETVEHCRRVEQLFAELGATSTRASRDEAERALLWRGRKSAFPAVGRISADYYCMDGTIPRGKLADVLGEISRMSDRYGLRVANVFHAGDGNLHPLILFDARAPGETEKAEAFGAEILELCVAVGGCITGEHGVGLEKIKQMPAQFDDAELEQFLELKRAFDPEGMLNPGKGVPMLKQCQEYRSLGSQRYESAG
jgi:glycolate oxidase